MDEEDIQICLGSHEPLESRDGAVLPPVSQASFFRKRSAKELFEALQDEDREFVYSRGTNPTVRVLETRLAALERGEACKCFASGMAAISSVLASLLSSGDHVLFINNIYGPTLQLASMLEDFGIRHTAIQGEDVTDFEKFIEPETKLIYFESPGSMTFRLAPVSEIARVGKKRGILTCIDNTVCTPLFQKPLTMGIDISVHSLTKYVGGHSDAVGGAVIASCEILKKIFYRGYMLLGGALAPQNAWLFLRGLMTMPNRVLQHQKDALEVAEYLETHPRVVEVLHPLLFYKEETDFGYTGLFSAVIDVDSFEELCAVVDRLELFGKAVSWGGAESLVIPAFGFDDRHRPPGIPENLVRFSIGLEGASALIKDLSNALEKR
ncbi:MAG: PLP-dependent transferase [Acidobacteria bacterium]|nr:MAG: PLP-dependent transferase [Acidobacteriota bacterium]REK03084.1 MAG: PLP-dependent transferase [Acidobacteriota bacterium]REK15432.1 MAG: PLP-dependent transferase [Acidobacteriota bacterium]REK45783.1 MAG: PLP-dependent transferase [Acidobacteriota bacterium]